MCEVSEGYMGGSSRACMGGIWAVYRGCICGIWEVYGTLMGSVWSVNRRYMGSVWGCVGGVYEVYGSARQCMKCCVDGPPSTNTLAPGFS